MKKLLLALAFAFTTSQATAVSITQFPCFTGMCASALLGVDIDGGLHDVQFVRQDWVGLSAGYPLIYLGNQSGAEAAVDAIIAELQAAGLIGTGIGSDDWNNGFFVPYGAPPNPLTHDVLTILGDRSSLSPLDWDRVQFDLDATGFAIYAVITASAVVPAPSAPLLLAVGLLVMGGLRRRSGVTAS